MHATPAVRATNHSIGPPAALAHPLTQHHRALLQSRDIAWGSRRAFIGHASGTCRSVRRGRAALSLLSYATIRTAFVVCRLGEWKGRDLREMRGGVGGRDCGVAGLLDPWRPFMCHVQVEKRTYTSSLVSGGGGRLYLLPRLWWRRSLVPLSRPSGGTIVLTHVSSHVLLQQKPVAPRELWLSSWEVYQQQEAEVVQGSQQGE
jgi:hypothetical protein